MLVKIGVLLLVLWIMGFFVVHVASGLIHILLILAILAVVIHVVSGRRRIAV
jgi:hypothetical protein